MIDFQEEQPKSTTKVLHSLLFSKGSGVDAINNETLVLWGSVCLTMMTHEFHLKKENITTIEATLGYFLIDQKLLVTMLLDSLDHPLSVGHFSSQFNILTFELFVSTQN